MFNSLKKIFQLPYFPIVLAPIILFSPTLFTGKALFWGTPSLQFIPWWDFAWETLLNGRIPLWNPLVGMGAPLVANYQTALFYPPNWIHFGFFAVGGVKWLAWAITAIVVLHLAWAGIGVARLLRDLGVGKFGQTIAGLTFSLSGYLISRAGFLSINAAIAWLPWIMLFSKQLAEKIPKSLLRTGSTIGLMLLAGHAQIAWYSILFAGIWILFWIINSSGKSLSLGDSIRTVGKFISACLMGFGISAIQLIPTLEYFLNSSRSAEYGYAEAMTYSFWPWRFFTLFIPELFGNPADGNYWGYGNYWEDALYIGVMPIAMALGLILGQIILKNKNKDGENKNRSLIIFLSTIILVGFIFALGKNTPIFPFLYRYIPTFDFFQAPTRFSIWVEFSLVLLVGIGIDGLKPPDGKRIYWNRLAVAGCVAAFISSLLAGFYLRDIKTTFIFSAGTASLWGLGSALLFLKQPGKNDQKKNKNWQNIVIIFIGLDLLIAGWGLNPSIEKDIYVREKDKVMNGRILISAANEYDLKFNKLFKFNSFEPDQEWETMFDHLLPNTTMLRNVEMVNNFDPIIPARYKTWMDKLNEIEWFDQDGKLRHQAFGLMAIGGVSKPDPDGSPRIIYFQISAKDQIRFFTCAEYISDENEVLELIMSEKVDTTETLLLESDELKNNGTCPDNIHGKYDIEAKEPGYLKLKVNLPESGWIFWSQSWYPGWKIKIDGIDEGMALKADYIFQAAEITAGEHRVEFLYSPLSFRLGALITGLTLIFMLVYELTIRSRD